MGITRDPNQHTDGRHATQEFLDSVNEITETSHEGETRGLSEAERAGGNFTSAQGR